VKNLDFQPSMSYPIAQRRAKILQQIRHFFLQRNVLEVETPVLSSGTVTDVYLEAFESKYYYSTQSNKPVIKYLQTSPEFALKRLLASGYGDIYQVCKAFRHEASGRYHNAEFSLLEWYRIGFDHFQLMEEVAALIKLILDCDDVEKISYQQLFINHVSVDPLTASYQDLCNVLIKHDKFSDWIADENDRDVVLQVILSEIIEPKIGHKIPCFIYHFPASQASLAQLSTADNRVAERFECYFRGIELVNGFHELTDASEQLSRFKQDNQLRIKKGLSEKPIDEYFIAALEAGIPDCSGVALGIDRLVMLACDCDHIEKVLTFSSEKA